MEKKEVPDKADHSENALPATAAPAADIPDAMGNAPPPALEEAKEKKPALAQLLAETFREGVASAKPGGGVTRSNSANNPATSVSGSGRVL